jgi:peptidoglycan-associated lipoprotein
MLKTVVVSGLLALLVGCGSTVPLNDVPVSDASATSVAGAAGANDGANGAGVDKRAVAGVDLGKVPAELASGPGRVIYFDYDSYVIRSEFQAVLANHAKFLRANPARKVAVEGHTDETGGREYNLALGQKRADAVRDALAILGVSRGQMESVSFGMEKPAMAGSDESAFAKNRRAEIRYE